MLAILPRRRISFTGKTVTGDCLKGTASLSHEIVPPTELLTPKEDEEVKINQLVLSWKPVEEAERYVVELNKEDTRKRDDLRSIPPTTSVAIPAHFLQPGSEYQFVVGTKIENGNVTFVELTFFTAP